MEKKGREGVSQFTVERFLSHSTEKVRWGKLRCFRKILVSQKVRDKKLMGRYDDFPSKLSCLTVPKSFIEELLCCRKFLVSKSFMVKRGGREGVSRLSVETFLFHCAEQFCGGTFLCFRKFLVSKKVKDKRGGGYYSFRRKFVVSQYQKKYVEEALCVSDSFWYRKV